MEHNIPVAAMIIFSYYTVCRINDVGRSNNTHLTLEQSICIRDEYIGLIAFGLYDDFNDTCSTGIGLFTSSNVSVQNDCLLRVVISDLCSQVNVLCSADIYVSTGGEACFYIVSDAYRRCHVTFPCGKMKLFCVVKIVQK